MMLLLCKLDFSRAFCTALLLLLCTQLDANAQLRPLDPTDFRALNGERIRLQIGGGVYFEQHASLAGTRGRLLEVGDMRASWRSGRILIEVAGTVQRFFSEDTVLQQPADGVRASSQDRTRHDAGDYRVQTILRLSGDTARTAAIIRFGTRLPTTDNRVGLERDQTDFFASLGAARGLGSLHLAAEAGVSINGTRLLDYEQSDVLIYAATLEYRHPLISPFMSIVGQQDFHNWAVRGNEDLGEVRVGLRLGRRQWINVMALRGFHDSSPRTGLVFGAGVALD